MVRTRRHERVRSSLLGAVCEAFWSMDGVSGPGEMQSKTRERSSMPQRHAMRERPALWFPSMDLLEACTAFLRVHEQGSFTRGAAASGAAQSVVSRRILALERHVGGALFDRATRRAVLTPLGRELLPAVRRLVDSADSLEQEIAVAATRPFRLALPEYCTTASTAGFVARAASMGLELDVRRSPAATRRELARSGEVRASVVPAPPIDAIWAVPLGLAAARQHDGGAIHLDSLRPERLGDLTMASIHLQEEDDVPHIRDTLLRLRDSHALLPSQVVVTANLVTAVVAAHRSNDFLLCSPEQSAELGLHWHPIADTTLQRCYSVLGELPEDVRLLDSDLWTGIAECLGAGAVRAPGE